MVPAASATMGMGDVKFLEGDVANIIVSIIHKNLKPEDVRADGLCCGGRGGGGRWSFPEPMISGRRGMWDVICWLSVFAHSVLIFGLLHA